MNDGVADPFSSIPIGFITGLPGESVEPAIYSDSITNEVLAKACSVGPEKNLIYIYLAPVLVGSLFDAKDLEFKEFCQNLVDGYGVKDLKPARRNFLDVFPVYEHVNVGGWRMGVQKDYSAPSIDLLMVPKLSERGFDVIRPSGVGLLGPSIQGLRLGISLETLTETLRKISKVTEGFEMEDLDENCKSVGFKILGSDNHYDLICGVSKRRNEVVYLRIGGDLVEVLFKKQDMSFVDFCQQFINFANIKKIEGRDDGIPYRRFDGEEGWMINFADRSIGRRRGYFEIELKSRPKGSDRGFGN